MQFQRYALHNPNNISKKNNSLGRTAYINNYINSKKCDSQNNDLYITNLKEEISKIIENHPKILELCNEKNNDVRHDTTKQPSLEWDEKNNDVRHGRLDLLIDEIKKLERIALDAEQFTINAYQKLNAMMAKYNEKQNEIEKHLEFNDKDNVLLNMKIEDVKKIATINCDMLTNIVDTLSIHGESIEKVKCRDEELDKISKGLKTIDDQLTKASKPVKPSLPRVASLPPKKIKS